AAASAAELASSGSAALPPAGRPSAIFSAADGAAVATSETGILVPVWTPEQEPEATGQIQTSRQRRDRAGTTTTASAPAPAKPAQTLGLPCRVLHNKKCAQAGRARRTSVQCARLSAESRANSRASCRRRPLATISASRLCRLLSRFRQTALCGSRTANSVETL